MSSTILETVEIDFDGAIGSQDTVIFADSLGSGGAVIKVFGVGGGGCNATNYMCGLNIENVDFVGLNTDAQALSHCTIPITIQLGSAITAGLGAGANPEIGRDAAYADREQIQAFLAGTDMVFVTAGMGGGTGTGAAPVVAEIAKEMGILTVAVVTKPFAFEGRKRMIVAEKGIEALSRIVDSLIVIPNNRLLTVLGKGTSLLDAFNAVNNVLFGAVKGIAELITSPGLMNVDFADVRTVMAEMGHAVMGMGTAIGEERARLAAEAAIASPLLEDTNLSNARGVLVNITAGLDLSIGEFEDVGEVIRNITSPDATVVVGTVINPDMEGISVTIVATGLDGFETNESPQEEPAEPAEQPNEYQKFYDRSSFSRRQCNTLATGGARGNSSSSAAKTQTPRKAQDISGFDVSKLDVPSYLRKQGDA